MYLLISTIIILNFFNILTLNIEKTLLNIYGTMTWKTDSFILFMRKGI
ncbi:hypothetical protein SAMN05421544_1091 [Riemerella columbipharyngis]|uniref:Uncharacterized protein n=1 Tax=Riemerella columbipharyngis TaxID=1071918 RepID=A0A1G7CTU7_9FLAO|nr:hypothetical protein SAMN05421544_1091 [Riemerella columbipharyngis]